MRYLWMPRLLERICAASGKSPAAGYGSVGRGDQVESGTESSGCTETADHNGGGICDEGSEGINQGSTSMQMDTGSWWADSSCPAQEALLTTRVYRSSSKEDTRVKAYGPWRIFGNILKTEEK
ncbi:hypothetical protein HPP92_001690 [Vanilla planifolia]|uniref:Uncharacterized protein n=1 Tax=Vanilla planifolia TaxID=51239 RepID=A0A835SD84_VANPL|nr:hypothetical protein HPP92_001690 [Vanilla planifolia]